MAVFTVVSVAEALTKVQDKAEVVEFENSRRIA